MIHQDAEFAFRDWADTNSWLSTEDSLCSSTVQMDGGEFSAYDKYTDEPDNKPPYIPSWTLSRKKNNPQVRAHRKKKEKKKKAAPQGD